MWNLIPPLQSLKLFDAVARCRSMTRAATEADISQSAVSQSIRQLEQFVQTTLLDRSSRPMMLTKEGEAFHQTAKEALGQLALAVEDLRNIGSNKNDAVTISCNLGFATYWLMPRLNYFGTSFPDIAVNVMAAFQGAAGIQSGIDLAIRFGDGEWSEGEWEILFRETIVPICSPEYLERFGPIDDPEKLAGHRLIHVASSDPAWLGWEQYLNHVGQDAVKVSAGPRFNNYVQAVQATLKSDGIMLGWRSVVGDLVNSQQLTVALNRPVQLDSGYYLQKSRNRRDQISVKELVGWLKQEAERTSDFSISPE